jgi:hypothetical protein
MKHVSELSDSLNVHFKWNKARIFCFSNMLLALFAVRTVNLREIATAFDARSKVDSRYKRLSRFFAYFKIDYSLIARWIFKVFFNNRSYQLVLGEEEDKCLYAGCCLRKISYTFILDPIGQSGKFGAMVLFIWLLNTILLLLTFICSTGLIKM